MAEQTDIYVGTTKFTDKGDFVSGYKWTYTDPDTNESEDITGYDQNDIVHTKNGVHLSLIDGNTSNPDTDKTNWRTWVDLTALVAAIAAEEIRKQNEAERVASETARKSKFAELLSKATAATDSADSAAKKADLAAASASERLDELETLARQIADGSVGKPEEMKLDYLKEISLKNPVEQKIGVSLVPSYYPRNALFQKKSGDSLDVDPFGKLTMTGKTGDTYFYVIPTNNTSLTVKIKITVREPYIMLASAGAFLKANDGIMIV